MIMRAFGGRAALAALACIVLSWPAAAEECRRTNESFEAVAPVPAACRARACA